MFRTSGFLETAFITRQNDKITNSEVFRRKIDAELRVLHSCPQEGRTPPPPSLFFLKAPLQSAGANDKHSLIKGKFYTKGLYETTKFQ